MECTDMVGTVSSDFAYNGENRPVCWSNADGTVIAVAYDHQGRRVWKDAGTRTSYLYDQFLCIRASGPQTQTFYWDPTESVATRPLCLAQGTNVLFYTHDLTKNVTELLDRAGEIVTAYDYAPFGAVTVHGPDLGNPYQWSSEQMDQELGLVYYNYRHYNPADGRWVRWDSLGERGGVNVYGFVGNNPSRLVDVLGRYRYEYKRVNGVYVSS